MVMMVMIVVHNNDISCTCDIPEREAQPRAVDQAVSVAAFNVG